MIFLDATNRSLEFKLGGAVSATELPFTSHFVDLNATFAVSDMESTNGVSNGVTAVTLVAAPGASTFLQVKGFTIYNADSASATVTVQYNDNTTLRILAVIALASGWTLTYGDAFGFITTDGDGKIQGSGGGGGSNHAILDGSVHTDSVADAVTRGSLIYGNATPKWDELVVGAANRLLTSDGTDVAWAQGDHGAALSGLGDDDHTIYALLAGRAGGQTYISGTAANNDATYKTTSNATKGTHLFSDADAVELVSGATAMELRLREPSGGGTSHTGFKAPALAGNVVYTLPTADGNAGELLKTDGSTVLSWVASGAGDLLADGTIPLTANWDVGAFDIRAATLTPDGITLGSVIFAGTAGVISQDNAKFFWDNSNNRLGIGTASPDKPLHVLTDGGTSSLGLDSYATSQTGNRLIGRSGRGTVASPAASLSGDNLFNFQIFGREDASNWSAEAGSFVCFTLEDFTPSAHGTSIRIRTVPKTTTAIATVLTADDSQNMIIGGANGPTTGSESLFMDNGTVPSSLDSRTSGLYSKDVSGTVELFGIDAGGTSNQLTPHNFELFEPDPSEPYPWSYYARNPYLGIEIACDMTKLARLVEQLTGETLIYTRPIPRQSWWDDREAHAEQMRLENEIWHRHQQEGVDSPMHPPESPRLQLARPPTWLYNRLKAQNRHAPAREAALLARFPKTVPSATIAPSQE